MSHLKIKVYSLWQKKTLL